MVAEIENTKLMLSDVQQKYHMVEKNVIFNAEKNTDSILKQAQERHSAQIALMQQQIDSLKSKYDDLEHDFKHLDIRYKELQRSREAMLIEKSEIINQLNRNLEESQRHVQDLLSRPDSTSENRRLQNAIRTIEFQKDELSHTVNKLQKKLQEQSSEIEMMDSIIHDFDANNASYAEASRFIHRDPLKAANSSTPMSPEVRLSKVKEELCKSLSNIKMKREQIKILEQQVAEKDKEIQEMKRDESKNLVELNKYRDEVVRLESKISVLQSEMAKNDGKAIQNELVSKKTECDELRLEMEKLCLSDNEKNEKLLSENEELKNELSELRKQLNDSQSPKACLKCDEYITKINKIELASLQLQNTNANQLSEINNLQQSLFDARQSIESLEGKLNLHNLRDDEIEKLKSKAKEFEEYMRSNIRFGSTSSPTNSSNNTSGSKADAYTETDEQNLAQIEKKIRDEMARIFANQINTLEKKFTAEVKKMQTHQIYLSNELDEKSSQLQIAIEQLEMLKFTIVSEREEFKSILEKKEEHVECYRKQVDELNEKVDIIYEERLSIENLKRQIDDERAALSRKEEETLQKLRKLQADSTKIIEELTEKYQSAKKTAQNYKQVSNH
jgi:asterless protein